MITIGIPYRDRADHLKIFLKYMIPKCKQYFDKFNIVIIEQNGDDLFNRGKLLNIGYKLYGQNSDYYITHDVDILPPDDIILKYYNSTENITRILSAHNHSLGGILNFKSDIFNEINGFPNDIWGWGVEDRAIYFRSFIKKISVNNSSVKKSQVRYLPHKRNNRPYKGKTKINSNKWSLPNINSLSDEEKQSLIENNGVNDCEYKIIKNEKLLDNIYHIIVDIGTADPE